MPHPWLLWILAAVVFALIEVTSISFIFLMFAAGALAAGLVALAGGGLLMQAIVFAAVSVILLIVVRPFLKGRIQKSGVDVRTNTDALVGRNAYVSEDVDERDGRVLFSGGEWSARTLNGRIEVGTEVRVVRIDGATAIVEPLTP